MLPLLLLLLLLPLPLPDVKDDELPRSGFLMASLNDETMVRRRFGVLRPDEFSRSSLGRGSAPPAGRGTASSSRALAAAVKLGRAAGSSAQHLRSSAAVRSGTPTGRGGRSPLLSARW